MLMKIHIVQKADTLQSVIAMYQISKEEIKKENPHISDIQQLIPGMKLKIPSDFVQVTTKQTQQQDLVNPILLEDKTTSNKRAVLKGGISSKHPETVYAQVHRRPMGSALEDDIEQRLTRNNKPPLQKQRPIHGVCCHCQQPIFTARDQDSVIHNKKEKM